MMPEYGETQFLKLGFGILKQLDPKRVQKWKMETKIEKFRQYYGSSLSMPANIREALMSQTYAQCLLTTQHSYLFKTVWTIVKSCC